MYYSRAGGRIEPRIRIGSPADPNARRILGDVRMELDAVSNLTVWMTIEEAEALSRDLIEHLYDKGALSMEAAERLTFLGNSVLADHMEPGCGVEGCTECEQVPAAIEYTEPPSIPAPGKPQSVIYLRSEDGE